MLSVCIKIPYASRSDAVRAAEQKPGLRVYKCQHCPAWHLSSKSKRQVRNAKKGRMLGSEADVRSTRVLSADEARRVSES